MTRLSDEVKRRKVLRWALAYLAGSWVLLQVIALLAEPFGWPPAQVVRSATVVLAILFLAAFIVAWYHGEHGHQRFSSAEAALLGVTAVIAIAGGVYAWRSQPGTVVPPQAAIAGDDNTIAVLPFDDLSQQHDQAYFTDGITEELLNVLQRIDGLRVAARTSSFQFRGQDIDALEVGRRLGVAHLVRGSIRKSGERIRINAQLVDSRNGYQLWSNRWDSGLEDVFAIEDSIAGGVALALTERLALKLGPSTTRRSVDAAAHDHYLRGLADISTGDEAAAHRAIAAFREAVQIDSLFAAAHAGIALAHMSLADAYVEPRTAYTLALASARRALALDSTNAIGMAGVGYASFVLDRKVDVAVQRMRAAVRRHPNSVETAFLAANLICALDNMAEGLALTRNAQRLDPYSFVLRWNEEVCLTVGGRYDDVIAVHAETRKLAPGVAYLDDFAAVAWRAKGQPERALAEYEHVLENPGVRLGQAHSYAQLGNHTEARRLLHIVEQDARNEYVPPSAIAAVYGRLGDFETALLWLDRADQVGDMIAVYMSKQHPDFAALMQNPRTAARIRAFVK